MDAIKKAQMTEDERKRAEKALQGRHDEHVARERARGEEGETNRRRQA